MKYEVSLTKLVDKMKTSFWFIPSLMLFGSIFAALFLSWLDNTLLLQHLPILKFAYQAEPDSMRALINVIAGSMITVTCIIFSITILTLTLASSQFGPRLIRNFMTDRGTQIVLGTFISNFSYCLVLIYIMSFEFNQHDVLGLSILWCLVTTFLSVVVLIYYIHHVSHSIQADTVINDVYRELLNAIQAIKQENSNSVGSAHQGSTYLHETSVASASSGYLQVVDSDGLVKLGQRYDIKIKLLYFPGDMLIEGLELFTVSSREPIDKEVHQSLQSYCVIGSKRTPIQDPEYAIHQMVEIAVRALSPGVNDPYTAITCVDKLSAMLCKLSTYNLFDGFHYDANGILRLDSKAKEFQHLANKSFEQIRQYGITSVAVTIRLLVSLEQLLKMSHSPAVREFAKQQLEAIVELESTSPYCGLDKQDFDSHVESVTERLD